MLPPRSMVGQLTLDQHIGVRIPGGQPNLYAGLLISKRRMKPVASSHSLGSQRGRKSALRDVLRSEVTPTHPQERPQTFASLLIRQDHVFVLRWSAAHVIWPNDDNISEQLFPRLLRKVPHSQRRMIP